MLDAEKKKKKVLSEMKHPACHQESELEMSACAWKLFCALAGLLGVVGRMMEVSQPQRLSHPDSPRDRLLPAQVETPQKAEQRWDRMKQIESPSED